MKLSQLVGLLFLQLSSSLSMDRCILVTGGNKGIGRAICARLLSEWDNTKVILGSRSLERGQATAKELKSSLNVGDDRIEVVELDVSSDDSVKQAVQSLEGTRLFGIVNNAGIMGRDGVTTMEQVINTNYFGPRRVNDAFGPMLQRPGGRIVNIGSASGPMYVSSISTSHPLHEKLSKPWLIGSVAKLDEIAKQMQGDEYGASKALVAAYTCLYAKEDKDLIINACTPGWIKTDMTRGSGASNAPEKGAVPPCWLMMDEQIAKEPTGRYYGSDCVRSPLDVYRGPGDAPYVSDEDLVAL